MPIFYAVRIKAEKAAFVRGNRTDEYNLFIYSEIASQVFDQSLSSNFTPLLVEVIGRVVKIIIGETELVAICEEGDRCP